MKAVLWDGNIKLKGELHITDSRVWFEMNDFENTSLKFDLLMEEVGSIDYHHMYAKDVSGIEITSKTGERNVFVVQMNQKDLKFKL